ncbi:hypothetical protein R1flu_002922 [Riccia fluitans]|uniref:Uncharacterized protein n=1 Tax=Riccia fluitans TaxID=41844 RepID=A0ABD1YAH9_9MARC
MVARLSTTTVDCDAAVGFGVLTTAYVTSTTACPDARSTIGPPPVVAGTRSLVASLAGLSILNVTDLNSDFLDWIFRCRDVIGDSSSIVSSSEDSCCPPPCGCVTSIARGFFFTGYPKELDDSLTFVV